MQLGWALRALVGLTCLDLSTCLLEFLTRGIQVVRFGDDREQEDQGAAQSEQADDRARPPCRLRLPAPQPKGGHHQQQPAEVEKQFHAIHAGCDAALAAAPIPIGVQSCSRFYRSPNCYAYSLGHWSRVIKNEAYQ